MSDLHKNLIGGAWVAGASTSVTRNPSDASDVIGEYAHADAAQPRAATPAATQGVTQAVRPATVAPATDAAKGSRRNLVNSQQDRIEEFGKGGIVRALSGEC